MIGHEGTPTIDADTTAEKQQSDLDLTERLAELDTAIYKLTQPHSTKILQRILVDGRWGRHQVTVHHDPLIRLLLDAAGGSGIQAGGGGRSSSSGMVLNAVAFQKISDLNRSIRNSWRRLVIGSDALLDSWHFGPAESLNLWHQTFTARQKRRLVGPPMIRTEAANYRSWVSLIELMFDPQPLSEFVGPCPRCGNDYVLTEDEERGRSVVISFPYALATCRACGETWSGESEFRRLNLGLTPHDTPPDHG